MSSEERERLDLLLVAKGLLPSREKARATVMAGEVRVNGQKVIKPGTRVETGSLLEVVPASPPYVSRGGIKLDKALREFTLGLSGKIILDVGASTGGFSDCALKWGAARVYAVDVGYGQLDWSLRQDPRVVNLERCNIRYLTREDLQGSQIHLALVDVSFISLRLVFPVLQSLEIPEVLALVKPQFEAGREQVGRGGVVRDPGIHTAVLEKVKEDAGREGYFLHNTTYSPIKGPKGNIEFWSLFATDAPTAPFPPASKIVSDAHESLKNKKEISSP